MGTEAFAELACEPDPPVEELALGLAAEFGPVDAMGARRRLDQLAAEVEAELALPDPDPVSALAAVIGRRHGFSGDTREYDHPDNSMLPVVLVRRRGLPITLSVVYVAVARRAEIPLCGVGLPGHFVAGHFPQPGARPELLDPFHNGVRIAVPELPEDLVRPWGPHETVLRMINNLVGSFTKRGALAHAIHAADLRLLLPVDPDDMERLTLEARALRARLN
ncbi:MAG: hypothetical protein JWO90_3239 [Solirubrobacterales bacterium]|jgi:regulator of sirC expression with transglutaminase-like and TPR domain|nr:hypothetical protein [Solirubrobacterales bacterium]